MLASFSQRESKPTELHLAWDWKEVEDYKEGEWQVGVDEVGLGPCFGPIVAGAVVLPDRDEMSEEDMGLWSQVRDSKDLSKKKREMLDQFIRNSGAWFGIGVVTVKEIDEIQNRHTSSHLAMHRAIDAMRKDYEKTMNESMPLHRILVDGVAFAPYHEIPYTTIVKGDAKALAIGAASILAKVYRDGQVLDLCEAHPSLKTFYSIHTNKGYPTPAHKKGIETHGVSPFHRMTDAPCVGKTVNPVFK